MAIDSSMLNPIRSVLYYPFPHIQDENWLKEQALFWDHLYRIVPVGFRKMERGGKRIDPTITERTLRDELDFVQDCWVQQGRTLDIVGTRMRSLVLNPRWREAHGWLMDTDERAYFTWARQEETKFVPGLRMDESWFMMPTGDAWRYIPGMIYMALLAKQVSASCGIPIVTDDAEHDLILKWNDLVPDFDEIPGWTEELNRLARLYGWATPPIPVTSDRTALLYMVILQRVGCEKLADVSPKRIVGFRKKYDDERRDFVDEVQRLASGLTTHTYVGEVELQQYLRECAEKIDKKRRNMVAALRGARIETVLRSAAVSAPLIAGVTGGLPRIGAALSEVLGTGAILYGARRARRTDFLKDSAAYYLLSMEKEFDTKRYLSRLRMIGGRDRA